MNVSGVHAAGVGTGVASGVDVAMDGIGVASGVVDDTGEAEHAAVKPKITTTEVARNVLRMVLTVAAPRRLHIRRTT